MRTGTAELSASIAAGTRHVDRQNYVFIRAEIDYLAFAGGPVAAPAWSTTRAANP
jgi:hypothetical protein